MSIKYPSFKGLSAASELASRVKRNNRKNDTKPELLLRKALWGHGLRFRKNVKTLPGKPDIVFGKAHLVIFCDGDFWHGRNWEARKIKLKTGNNANYWLAKIEANIERDKRNTKLLEENGWNVIRVWESDIKKNLAEIVSTIENAIKS